LVGHDTQERFSTSVSIDGDFMAIGAFGESSDSGAYFGGAVYLYERVNSEWVFQEELHAPDASAYDYFGMAVSLDGDSLAVGASNDNDAGVTSAGAVYVFERINSEWVFQEELHALDAAAYDYFGQDVSLDGNHLAVGAFTDDDSGEIDGGAVYLYERVNSQWVFQEELHAGDLTDRNYFGVSVSLDGDFLAVGAHGDDDTGADRAGSVYVYERVNSDWVLQEEIHASDAVANDQFGMAVSLDGDNLLIGARYDDDSGLENGGAAYLYKRVESQWVFQEEFFAPDLAELGSMNYFGSTVCLDGSTIAVGAPYDNDGHVNGGALYLFENDALLSSDDTRRFLSLFRDLNVKGKSNEHRRKL